jgi:hypothetical protein
MDTPTSSLRSEGQPTSDAADPGAPWVDTANQVQWKKFYRIAVPFAVANGLVTLFLGPVGWLITVPGSVLWCIILYRRRFPGELSAGRGARMGCAVGFLSFTAFAVLFVVVYCLTGQLRPMATLALQQAASRNSDPAFQQMVQFFNQNPAGMTVFVVMILAFALLLFLTFASAAGALTAAVSGNKSKR